jgi:hypothetical protein
MIDRKRIEMSDLHFLNDLLIEQDFVNVGQELFVQDHEKEEEEDFLEMYELILIHLLNFDVVQVHLLINHYY